MGRRNPRSGKRQILAFITPAESRVVSELATGRDSTLQGIMGEVMNAVFAFYGAPAMPNTLLRRMRRTKRKAAPREAGEAPNCRVGRISFGGWFAEDDVHRFLALCREQGMTAQDGIEFGIRLITDDKAKRVHVLED